MAGGAVLNHDRPRLSDDLDIFHDTDEEIVATARADIELLRAAGFRVVEDVVIFGVVECTVSRGGQSTLIQWMSETRTRFLPLVLDERWGVRLSDADLAINKVLAASSRTRARDYIDLITIAETYAPIGPLVLAAAGKPPNLSPQRMIDEIRRRSLSVSGDELLAVRGGPDASVDELRQRLALSLDAAEDYIRSVPPTLVGLLALDGNGIPAEISSANRDSLSYREPTDGGATTPVFPDNAPRATR
jgi:hypothetical protein